MYAKIKYSFRFFDNGEDPSEGYVAAYLPPDGEEPAWWRLVYTDNDAEDMYEEEVCVCIRNYQKKYKVAIQLQKGLEETNAEVLDLSNACESDNDSKDTHQLSSSRINLVSHHEYDDALDDVNLEEELNLKFLDENGQSDKKKSPRNKTFGTIGDILIQYFDEGGLKVEEDYERDKLEVEAEISVGDINDMDVITDPVYWSDITDSAVDNTNDSSSSKLNPIGTPEVLQTLPPSLLQPILKMEEKGLQKEDDDEVISLFLEVPPKVPQVIIVCLDQLSCESMYI